MTKGITSRNISAKSSFTHWKRNYDDRGTTRKINPFSSSRTTTSFEIKEIYDETLNKETKIRWY